MIHKLKDQRPKDRRIAVALAFAGVLLPIAGLHKLYLGQIGWGVFYLLLGWTPIPRVASAVEALWYLFQSAEDFDLNFNGALAAADTGTIAPVTPSRSVPTAAQPSVNPQQIESVAEALRQLDRLRQDGLVSEYEFEQKRRQLLDRMV